MKIKQISKIISDKASSFIPLTKRASPDTGYRPTPYLSHPLLQSIYNIT
jgi:hypothetical protein